MAAPGMTDRDSNAPPLRRVGLVFSGGPAPGANAVIAAAGSAFRRAGIDVVGLLHGYSRVLDYDGNRDKLVEGQSHRTFSDRDLRGLRNARGVFLGTARAHPGTEIKHAQDVRDPEKTKSLARVYRALCDLELDALISIGGDGTLRSANLLYLYQQQLPADARRVRVVHVPKTIDNDYAGIDFTFGFFTAVDVMAKEVLNLRADALATRSYYIVTTMGRKAGWLAYGVAVAGEAHLVMGVEDVGGALLDADGKLELDALADHLCDLILARRARGKEYGVIVLAEGLSGLLPDKALAGGARDAYGHVTFATLDLSRLLATKVAERHQARTGQAKKVAGVQLGYESRCSAPHAFDVMLGSQLGHGAFRALCERGLDGCMVSVAGQLELRFVAFDELVDDATLTTEMRFIEPGSDFHGLAQALGTRLPPK